MAALVLNNSNASGPWEDWGGMMVLLHHTPNGIALVSLLSILALLIVLANALVFWLMIARSRLRTPTNYCLLSLATSDLLAGSVVIPLVLACACMGFPPYVCISMDLCQRFLSISTILHLLVATLERYLKIRKPFTYPRLVTKRRVAAVVLGVWVFSLSMSLIQLLWISLNGDEQEQARIRRTEVIYTAICLTALVLAPFLVMLFAYLHMFIVIRREMRRRREMTHRKRSRESEASRKRKENERKVVIVYLSMFISFVLGWFPYFLLSLFNDLLSMDFAIPFWADCIMILLKFGTAFVNPVLYTFFKNDFQNALKSLTMDRWCNTNKKRYHQPPNTVVSSIC